MIIGMNEKLEKMMLDYQDRNEEVEFSDVMDCIVDSVAAGDTWNVPVQVIEDGMNETDFREGWILEKLPAFYKRTIRNKNDEELFCAFTNETLASKIDEDGTYISVKYPARELLRELVAAEECSGLVINPWSDAFFVSRSNAEKILQYADEIPRDGVLDLLSCRIEPRAMIDTEAILQEWKSDWHDDEGREESWELVSYPIMADGRILLLFVMKDEIHGGSYDSFRVIHTHSHYRVLEYEMDNGELKLKNRYRFKAQDAHVGTVFLYHGVLRAAISVDGSDKYKILTMFPIDDDSQFSIYSSIETLTSNSRGDIIVAYNNNLRDKARWPMMVFDENGKVEQCYKDEWALYCSDVNIDKDENVWFHMFPSTTINRMDADADEIERHKVELQGFSSFALSSDKTKLFVQFSESGASLQYILTLDKDGNYVNPIRFDFRPEGADGKILEAKDCGVFGRAATTKSWVLLNADGRLYLYDIDDCCDHS